MTSHRVCQLALLFVGFSAMSPLAPAADKASSAAETNSLSQFTEKELHDAMGELKARLGWNELAEESHARQWWSAFEEENKQRLPLVLKVLQELEKRHASIELFFLSYVYCNSDNILAALEYMSYRIQRDRDKEDWDLAEMQTIASPEALDRAKRDARWQQTTGDARQWWLEFEQANRHRLPYLLKVLAELKKGDYGIEDLFLAYVNSHARNAQAAISYLNYARNFKTPSGDATRIVNPLMTFRASPHQCEVGSEVIAWQGRNTAKNPISHDQQMHVASLKLDALIRLARQNPEEIDESKRTLAVLPSKYDAAFVQAYPDSPWALDLTARAWFACGNTERAVELTEQALRKVDAAAQGGEADELRRDLRQRLDEYRSPGRLHGWVLSSNDGGKTLRGKRIGPDGTAREWMHGVCDDSGRLVSVDFTNEAGKPVLYESDGDVFSRWTAKYDESGKELERTYYRLDEHGRLQPDAAGIAYWTSHYEGGVFVGRSYYDQDHAPAITPSGCSEWIVRSTPAGGSETAFLRRDRQGRPLPDSNGFAAGSVIRDASGTLIGKRGVSLDEHGKPKLNVDGFASKMETYDKDGHVVETEFFDVDGKPAASRFGYARSVNRYQGGLLRETRFFGPDGQPATSETGEHGVRTEYDDSGREIESVFFDKNEHLFVPPTLGYAGWTTAYDPDTPDFSRVTYFNVDRKPTICKDGYCCRKTRIKNGGIVERRFFGLNGEPTTHQDGYHMARLRYNANVELLEMAFFDMRGEPVRASEGYARIAFNNDATSSQRVRLFDVDNRELDPIVVVDEVLPETIASKLKLRPGDVVESYAGKPIRGTEQLSEQARAPGDAKRSLVVRRGKETLKFEVEPGPLGVLVLLKAAPPTNDSKTDQAAPKD